MRDMMNVAFQNAWFGPFVLPNVYSGEKPKPPHAGTVYNDGPLDGLIEASMHAQWFSQIPVMNRFQATPRMAGAEKMGAPVFCKPGYMPVPTGTPGESKCVPYSPPSAMVGGGGPGTVSQMIPPNWPTSRSFPVGPFYGFQE